MTLTSFAGDKVETYEVLVVPESEYEKAERDPSYAPREVVVGTVSAEYWGQAEKKASKLYGKRFHLRLR